LARAYVYIDGFNLYYGALKRTPYKWLDLGQLCRQMLPNDTIESIQYFTARVSARPYNLSAPLDQQAYLRALRTVPNLSITFGHFLTHSVRMVVTGSNPMQKVFVDKTEEKGSDVNLAAHLLRDSFLRKFETAVLVTNDSDLAEPVRIVRHDIGLPVGILNPHQRHSVVLKNLATFVKRIRQADLIASQFPAVIADAKGEIRKPAGW
jgi:NYN domain